MLFKEQNPIAFKSGQQLPIPAKYLLIPIKAAGRQDQGATEEHNANLLSKLVYYYGKLNINALISFDAHLLAFMSVSPSVRCSICISYFCPVPQDIEVLANMLFEAGATFYRIDLGGIKAWRSWTF